MHELEEMGSIMSSDRSLFIKKPVSKQKKLEIREEDVKDEVAVQEE